MLLYQILANYTQKNIKNSCKNNKFKMSAPIWNEEFELPDGSYSTEKTVNSSIKIYVNKI